MTLSEQIRQLIQAKASVASTGNPGHLNEVYLDATLLGQLVDEIVALTAEKISGSSQIIIDWEEGCEIKLVVPDGRKVTLVYASNELDVLLPNLCRVVHYKKDLPDRPGTSSLMWRAYIDLKQRVKT
jgi:hypothetical protein